MDEHYQVVEFAYYGIGKGPEWALPWEYIDKIRPTVQPVILMIILKLCYLLKISDPYTIMTIVRIIGGLLLFYAIAVFRKRTESVLVENYSKRIYLFLSCFLWFIPFIAVRYSSETWSALFLLLGTGLALKDGNTKAFYWRVGILFGLSFIMRFQTAFYIAPFLLWLVFKSGEFIKSAIFVFIGLSTVVLAGIISDSWFYGDEWIITPYRYFVAFKNSGSHANFAVEPWYFFLKSILYYPGVIVGGSILFLSVFGILSRPKDPIIWATISFVFFHSLVGHKEERFLFPIVFMVPYIMSLGIDFLLNLSKEKVRSILKGGIFLLLVPINLFGSSLISVTPAGSGKMNFTQYVRRHYGNKPIRAFAPLYGNPYSMWGEFTAYYRENDMENLRIDNFIIEDSLYRDDAVNFFMIRKMDLYSPECKKLIADKKMKLLFSSHSDFIRKINTRFRKEYERENDEVFMLYLWEKDSLK